ncbi:extra spindle pole bodies like 1, separase isoform X2 [Rhodnius prolixus]|uniref:extra spindle pole bodies like 1, separase isoform X2 n=1 Tax=Rhodnius prolixus TaxID=13249 RepID=UPI003D187DD3
MHSTSTVRTFIYLSYSDCISFEKGYAKNEAKGMIQRLKEMPSEWTIVQLTREFNIMEPFNMRVAETTPHLKGFHLTRLPCGLELEIGCPVTVEREWPESAQQDLIAEFWKIKKQLSTISGSSKLTRKLRNEAALDVEKYCREIGQVCLKEWFVLFLGTLCDKSLSTWIKGKIDRILSPREGVSKRQKYLTHLLAEGIAHVSDDEIDLALLQLFPEDTKLQDEIVEVLAEIKREKPCLAIVRRHPVILIVDEHLDLIPWESLLVLRRHPISRVPSLHFAHALHKIHAKEIKNGLRELDSNGICYYVLNPGGDLRSVEERLGKFIQTRFPSWIGIVGQKPTEEQLVQALTSGNAFIYCGHGSGCQYLTGDCIQRLKVKPVQLLFGCSSVALKDHGGCVEMTGDFLQFAIAGSGCTLGMLWPVTSSDVDRMTLVLANMWLPGEPIDINTFQKNEEIKKEPDLLRALVEVRKHAELFSNGAGFVARGIPIKLI